jgi:hypothetical protein
MYIVIGIILACVIVLLIFLLAGAIRTWQMQHGRQQKLFLKGTLPPELPDGFYQGTARGYTGPWIGKTFYRKGSTGTNDFAVGEKDIKKFPFRMYRDTGLRDINKQVLKIDYNIAGNPFFVRLVLDEIVALDEDTYLGKIHMRFPSFFPMTVGYFSLKKQPEEGKK